MTGTGRRPGAKGADRMSGATGRGTGRGLTA